VAADEAVTDKPVHQPDCAVMADAEPLGQRADGDALAAGKSFDHQEGLVLLRAQPGLLGGGIAERNEAPQEVAELRQRLVIGLAQRRAGSGATRHRPRWRQACKKKPVIYIAVRYI